MDAQLNSSDYSDEKIEDDLERISRELYDATERQLQLGIVKVYRGNAGSQNTADIVISSALEEAAYATGLGRLGYPEAAIYADPIYLSENRHRHVVSDAQTIAVPDSSAVMVHELGHLVFGIGDSYLGFIKSGNGYIRRDGNTGWKESQFPYVWEIQDAFDYFPKESSDDVPNYPVYNNIFIDNKPIDDEDALCCLMDGRPSRPNIREFSTPVSLESDWFTQHEPEQKDVSLSWHVGPDGSTIEPFEATVEIVTNHHRANGDISAWETIVKRYPGMAIPHEEPSSNIEGYVYFDDNSGDDVKIEFVPPGNEIGLIIDASPSMEDENRIGLAKFASKLFVGLGHKQRTAPSRRDDVDVTIAGDFLSIVSFAGTAKVEYSQDGKVVQMTSDNRKLAKESINDISIRGSTSIGAGLETSLTTINTGSPVSKSMILLSDGGENTPPMISDVKEDILTADVHVYSVALGPSADTQALSELASDTNGKFFAANNAWQLIGIYGQLYGIIRNDSFLHIQGGIASLSGTNSISTVAENKLNWSRQSDPKKSRSIVSPILDLKKPGNLESMKDDPIKAQVASTNPVQVVGIDASIVEATFLITSDGAQGAVTLTDPNGHQLSGGAISAYPGATFESGEGYTIFRIESPSIGFWQVEMEFAETDIQWELRVFGVEQLISCSTGTSQDVYSFGTPVLVRMNCAAPVPVIGGTAWAVAVGPDGSEEFLYLFDDGDAAHGDEYANDAIYSNLIMPDGGDGAYTITSVFDSEGGTGPVPGSLGLPVDTGMVSELPFEPVEIPYFQRYEQFAFLMTGSTSPGDLLFKDSFEGTAQADPPVVSVFISPANPQTPFSNIEVHWTVQNPITSCSPSDSSNPDTEWEAQGSITDSTGFRIVSLEDEAVTFTLACEGPGGSHLSTAIANFGVVEAPVVSLSLSSENPQTPFSEFAVQWEVQNSFASCLASDDASPSTAWETQGAITAPTGSRTVNLQDEVITFSLACVGPGGDSTTRITADFGTPLDLSITSSADPVREGTSLTFTMTVSNPSLVTQTNVVLEVLTPDYMSFYPSRQATPPGICLGGSSLCDAGDGIQWLLGDLSPGEIRVISFTDQVSTGAVDGDLVTASAVVTADGVADVQDSYSVVVRELAPNLQLAISADHNPAAPDQLVSFQLRYSNRSVAPTSVTADSLRVTLAEGLTFVSASDNGTELASVVSWPISVASGVNGAREFKVRVNTGEMDGTLLPIEARIEATLSGTTATAAETLTIASTPSLELMITSSADPVQDGTLLIFTMAVSNPSLVTRTNVVLEALTPGYMSFYTDRQATPPGVCLGSATCDAGEGIRWVLGNLSPGEVRVINFTDEIITSAGDGELVTATAVVMADDVSAVQDSHTVVIRENAPDLQLAISVDHNPAAPDQLVSFQLRYSNRSVAPTSVTADSLRVTLPEGLTFVSASDNGTELAGVVSWPISVPSGVNGAREFKTRVNTGEMDGTLLPIEARIEASLSGTTATAAEALTIASTPSLDLMITSSADPVQDGTLLIFTMTVSNPGLVSRTNVVLEALTPGYMSFYTDRQATPPGVCLGGATCDAGEGIRWVLGNLSPGEVRVVRFSDLISTVASDGELLTATAVLKADGVSTVQDNHTVVVSENAPDLQLAISADHNPAAPGQLVTYQLRYSNRSVSPAALTANKLTAVLPAGLTFVSARGGGTESEGLVSWPISVASGTDGVREFTARVNTGESDGALFPIEARFEAGLNGYATTAAEVLVVKTVPALNLMIASSVDPVEEGSVLTFTMTVSNPGQITQTNVVLESLTPGYMSFYSDRQATPPGVCLAGSTCDAGEGIRWVLGNLAAGEVRVVRFSDLISTAASDGELLSATAVLKGDGVSAVQDSHTVVVREDVPDLQLTVSADHNPATQGQLVTYQLRYSNRSVTPTAVTADSLSVTLPEGLTFVSASDGGTELAGVVSWPISVASRGDGVRVFTVIVNPGEMEGALLPTKARIEATSSGTTATATEVLSIIATPPLDLMITSSADPVEDGTALTFTMTVSNPSQLTRTNVVLEALTPGFMSFNPLTQATPPGNCFSGSTSCSTSLGVRWLLGNLTPGEVRVVRFSDLISTGATDGELLTLEATVSADGVSDAQDKHSVVVREEAPDLQLAISTDQNPAIPDQLVTFQLRYSNRNVSSPTVTANKLTARLPVGLTFISADGGGTESGGVVTWPISVTSGVDGAREFTVRVNAGETDRKLIPIGARFEDTLQAVAATAGEVLVVDTAPSLDVLITSSADPVVDGTAMTYTMTVSNPSEVLRTNVVLEALTPGYISFNPVTQATPPGSCFSGSTSCGTGLGVRWLLGNLSAGEAQVVSFTDVISTNASDGELLTLDVRVSADGVSDVQDSHAAVISED